MSDDDIMNAVEKSYQRWTGEGWSPEKVLENFALYGKAKRIETLENLDSAVKVANPTSGNLRNYSRLTALQREAERLHQLMIRNGK